MAYAHDRGVIHLDLKPENIQCDNFGEVLVCDWGLGVNLKSPTDTEALELERPTPVAEEAELMMKRAQSKGTPGFMAPEQFRADSNIDARADVYALGCLLSYIITGNAPFRGSREELEEAMQSAAPLRTWHPELNIPEGLDAIVNKAMMPDADARYENGAALQADLNRYLAGFATLAEQPGPLRKALLFFISSPYGCGDYDTGGSFNHRSHSRLS